MNIEKLRTHKKYLNDYFLVNGEIYTKDDLLQFFKTDDKELELLNIKDGVKLIKPYRYKNKRFMQKKIIENRNNLFANLKLEKAKNNYENLKILQPLLKHFLKILSHNALIAENRLFSLKHKKYELKERQKSIEKAYKKEVYNVDREYKKTRQLIKQIEKQTQEQNTKILFDTLINNLTTNTNDNYTLMYLLNKLNVEAYCLTMKNKETNKTYTLLLVSSKKNSYDNVKYYVVDITKNRKQIKHEAKEENKIELFSKNKLEKEFDNYDYVKIENLQRVILPNTKEWNKIIKYIATDTLEFNY